MQDRRIDAISGPPDPTRPKNPWPRLIAFGLGVLGALFLLGYCVAVIASPPPRELRVPLESIEVGLPRFTPVTVFGADRDGNTYGAWVTYNGREARAFLSRQPETLCHLGWNATHAAEDASEAGAFTDRCGEAAYTAGGEVIAESAPRDMDAFPVRIDGREIVVDIMRLHLGQCREGADDTCSPPGQTRELRMPRNQIAPGFAPAE